MDSYWQTLLEQTLMIQNLSLIAMLFTLVSAVVLYILMQFGQNRWSEEYPKYFKYSYFALVIFVFIVFMASVENIYVSGCC